MCSSASMNILAFYTEYVYMPCAVADCFMFSISARKLFDPNFDSVYCLFIVCALHQPCAEINFFSFFNGSYLSTPSLRFQSDPVPLYESMDCGHGGVLVLKCRLLICPNYKVIAS